MSSGDLGIFDPKLKPENGALDVDGCKKFFFHNFKNTRYEVSHTQWGENHLYGMPRLIIKPRP